MHLMKSVRSKHTENGGKRVVSAGVTTGSRRPEVKTTADCDVRRIANEGVALFGAAARHGRPSDRIERREIKAKHVAPTDADELGSLEDDLVKPQLGRLDVGLSHERVDSVDSTEHRRVRRARR